MFRGVVRQARLRADPGGREYRAASELCGRASLQCRGPASPDSGNRAVMAEVRAGRLPCHWGESRSGYAPRPTLPVSELRSCPTSGTLRALEPAAMFFGMENPSDDLENDSSRFRVSGGETDVRSRVPSPIGLLGFARVRPEPCVTTLPPPPPCLPVFEQGQGVGITSYTGSVANWAQLPTSALRQLSSRSKPWRSPIGYLKGGLHNI